MLKPALGLLVENQVNLRSYELGKVTSSSNSRRITNGRFETIVRPYLYYSISG